MLVATAVVFAGALIGILNSTDADARAHDAPDRAWHPLSAALSIAVTVDGPALAAVRDRLRLTVIRVGLFAGPAMAAGAADAPVVPPVKREPPPSAGAPASAPAGAPTQPAAAPATPASPAASVPDQTAAPSSGSDDDLGVMTRIQDWLARANRDYQNVIVKELSLPSGDGKAAAEIDAATKAAAAKAAADAEAAEARMRADAARKAEADAKAQAAADAQLKATAEKAAAEKARAAAAKAAEDARKAAAAKTQKPAPTAEAPKPAAPAKPPASVSSEPAASPPPAADPADADAAKLRAAADAARQAEARRADAARAQKEQEAARRADAQRRQAEAAKAQADTDAARHRRRTITLTTEPIARPSAIARPEARPTPGRPELTPPGGSAARDSGASSSRSAEVVDYEPDAVRIDRGPVVRRWIQRQRPAASGCRHAGRRIAVPGRYTVGRGDTLWGISARHYKRGQQYHRIYRANRQVIRDPDLIYPCQRFRLPRRR